MEQTDLRKPEIQFSTIFAKHLTPKNGSDWTSIPGFLWIHLCFSSNGSCYSEEKKRLKLVSLQSSE